MTPTWCLWEMTDEFFLIYRWGPEEMQRAVAVLTEIRDREMQPGGNYYAACVAALRLAHIQHHLLDGCSNHDTASFRVGFPGV